MATNAGLRHRMPGPLPPSDVRTEMARSRVVVVASRHDNLPNVALEALAAGRPVVATANAGLTPILDAVGPGLVVPAEDPDALAAAIRPLLADASLAEHLGERGRAVVDSRHGVDANADAWVELLERVRGKRAQAHGVIFRRTVLAIADAASVLAAGARVARRELVARRRT
jgi:glycosyltransferase involved in cell wall biosynthesis